MGIYFQKHLSSTFSSPSSSPLLLFLQLVWLLRLGCSCLILPVCLAWMGWLRAGCLSWLPGLVCCRHPWAGWLWAGCLGWLPGNWARRTLSALPEVRCQKPIMFLVRCRYKHACHLRSGLIWTALSCSWLLWAALACSRALSEVLSRNHTSVILISTLCMSLGTRATC